MIKCLITSDSYVGAMNGIEKNNYVQVQQWNTIAKHPNYNIKIS